MSAPVLPPDLRARVLQAVSQEPVPVRGEKRWRRAWPLIPAFGFLLYAFRGINFRGRPEAFVWAVGIAWLPIAAFATWVAVGRGRSMLGRPAPWLVAVLALTPVAMMLTWAGLAVAWSLPFETRSTAHNHLLCDVVGLVLALGPLLALGYLRKQTDPVRPRLTGAAIGTAAAAWAAVVHHFLCALESPRHVFLGHVAPLLAVSLVGAFLTARTVAVRAKTG